MTTAADYARYVFRCRLEQLVPFTPVGYRVACRPYSEHAAWEAWERMCWRSYKFQGWKRKRRPRQRAA